MKHRLYAPILLLSLASQNASAEGVSFFGEAGVSSAVHDRGEMIGFESFEAGFGAEAGLGPGIAYGGMYRLTPFGSDQDVFDDEFDYTLGYLFEGEGYELDFSANWLTYPGEGSDASLELVGVAVLDAPLSPELMVFYDADFEDFGAEVAFSKEVVLGAGWTGFGLGRAGFVEPGDRSANRSYIGLEVAAARELTEQVGFELYAQADWADEESFLKDPNTARDHGVAAGVRLGFVLGE